VQKFENIFARAKRLVQQISMAGVGVRTFFICLRTMTRSYINSYSTISLSLLSCVHFSFNFCPNLRGGGLLFAFLKQDGGLRPLCVGQSGADAQLGSSAIIRETRLTNTSQPHIPILCNAQVAFRMVPRDARSCSTCSMICPRRNKTLMNLSPSSTPTSRRLFRKCARQTSFDTLTGTVTKPYDHV
jgi:hypothetical protein